MMSDLMRRLLGSRGVVGALVVILSVLASLLGLPVTEGDLARVATDLVTLGGGVLALWGRLHARGPLVGTAAPTPPAGRGPRLG